MPTLPLFEIFSNIRPNLISICNYVCRLRFIWVPFKSALRVFDQKKLTRETIKDTEKYKKIFRKEKVEEKSAV